VNASQCFMTHTLGGTDVPEAKASTAATASRRWLSRPGISGMVKTRELNEKREEMETPRIALVAAVMAAISGLAAPAGAQDAVDVEKAKAEGKVVWYTSTPIEQGQKIADAFQKEYGIKVEMFRSGGSAILRRFQQESDAGRVAADVLTHSEPAAANAMGKKGLFVAFKPRNFDKVPDAAKDPTGLFIGQRLNMMTHYLRSDKVAAADEPKTWNDLADAKYRGKLVMTDPSFTSLQVSVVGMISKERGWGFYEKLRANDVMIVQGNQQVSDMLKRGERLIGVGALDSYASDLKKEGHPIKTLYPGDGVFVIPSPTSVVKGSPSPNAAKLFAEFMIGDTAQKIFPADGGYSARIDIAAPEGSPDLKTLKILAVDTDYIEKETGRIKRKFNEIFQ
jgi:iron(III) transport system substrate-binding protein